MARTHAERAERDINVDENGNSDQTRTTRTRGSSEVCAVVNEAVRHTCSVAMVRSKSTPWKSILIRGTVAAEGSGPRPGKGHGVSMIDTAIRARERWRGLFSACSRALVWVLRIVW